MLTKQKENNMNILVTGCAGFIGSHLCERLIEKNHTIIGIDNFDIFYDRSIKEKNLEVLLQQNKFHFFENDIRNSAALNEIEANIDLVIHLAAKAGVRPSIQYPNEYIDINIQGTLNILNFMVSRNIKKILFGSSSSVYGNNAESPFNESQITDEPISPYAFTKKCCELLLYTYSGLHDISSVALRFFTVYGPRQRPDLAIHKFFDAIAAGKPIQVFGDGTTHRDYTFIQDIIGGIEGAIDFICDRSQKVFEVINLGNNNPISLKDLILEIEETLGKKALIEYKNMQPGDMPSTCADVSKAIRLLNYNPKTAIKQGLAQFWDWKKEFL